MGPRSCPARGGGGGGGVGETQYTESVQYARILKGLMQITARVSIVKKQLQFQAVL